MNTILLYYMHAILRNILNAFEKRNKDEYIFLTVNFFIVIFRCLLDVMSVALVDMDIYSAEYVKEKDYKPSADPTSDLIFSSFVVVRQVSSLASSLRQTQTHISAPV